MIRIAYRSKRPVIKRIVTTLAVALCTATAGFAHHMPGSLTTIKRNPDTGAVEVVHRLHTHDAELGIMTFLKDRSLTLDQLVGRARLSLYVESHFHLADFSADEVGRPLQLELVGAELDGEFVLVYQQLHGKLPCVVAVRNDILRDVFPDQVNQVNIAVDGHVKSLTFNGKDEWLSTHLD